MTQSNQKLKLLYLGKIFFEETDREQGLSMPQLVERLEELGISAERKALYRDIAALREFGMDIQKLHTSPVEYALVNREFSQMELVLLADCVQSSRFLTRRKAEDLVRSLKTLGSKRQVRELNRQLHVEGRIKMQNESVFYNVDTIQQAIRARRKISFRYYKYDVEKNQKLQHGGERYVTTAVQLVFSDGCYYLVSYSDKYDDFANYRVDRMVDLELSDERASRNEKVANFDATQYESQVFGMFSGEPVSAVLLVDESAMGAVIDRFGKDVGSVPSGDGKARVHVVVHHSPTFYGWVAQFGPQVRIEKPKALVDGFQAHLSQILDSYVEH